MSSVTSIIKTARVFLQGKKTYVIGAAMLVIAAEKYFTGSTTLSQFLTSVQGLTGFNGLLAIAMRAGIAKK
jgi:hypothetical protein